MIRDQEFLVLHTYINLLDQGHLSAVISIKIREQGSIEAVKAVTTTGKKLQIYHLFFFLYLTSVIIPK